MASVARGGGLMTALSRTTYYIDDFYARWSLLERLLWVYHR